MLILGLSLVATWSAWRLATQQGEALERVRVKMFADEAVGELQDRMDGYSRLLLSGVALLEASDDVSREEWQRFFARVDLTRLYPGTQGVGLAVRVPPDRRAAHEAMVRREGFANYRITPADTGDDAFPIVYIEPFDDRNLRAFGYDMYTEPTRRAAMARARDTGEPALTAKVVLVQENGRDVQPGVLLYRAYYGHAQPADVAGRRTALAAFVYSPLRMGDLVRGVLGDRLRWLCLQLYDQEAVESAILFTDAPCATGKYADEKHLEVFGRHWIVRVQSTPALDDQIASRRSKFILVAGVIISLLLVWAVSAMLAEHHRRVALDRALAELESARAEAAGAAAAKGRFLAAASHDLRQPLQSLGLYLHLLLDQRGADGPVERAARQAYDATQRLVEGMFDAAALDSGRAKPTYDVFDAAELVEQIATESLALAAMNGLFLRRHICHAMVRTDRVMLERLMRNLVSNALKYTRRGGVLLTCQVTDHTVRLKVADSGPGIPKDKQKLIFEDLYQLENPERDPRKGLGLGLATVARLARLLDYRLRLYSRPGMGSTFVIELPRAP